MNFNIPSYANDYEFVVCIKDDDFNFSFYSVAENGFVAEKDCDAIRELGKEPVILHNVRIQGKKR